MHEPKFGANDPLAMVIDYLEKLNEDQLAEKVIDVFAKNSKTIEQYNIICKLYLDIRSVKKAIYYGEKVLELCINPQQLWAARANLAKLYNNINEPEKSYFYSNINNSINPNDVDTKLELVFSLYLMNRKKEAEEILLSLKSIENQLTEKHRNVIDFNLGSYALEQGRVQDGLKGFLLGAEKLQIWFSPRKLPGQFWRGGSFPGQTLVIFCEGGGIGDEMIMIRFFNDIKKLGMNPVYYTHRDDICNLFNQCGYYSVTNIDDVPRDYMWTYFMQLPIWLNSTTESVKRIESYLHPSQQAINKFSFMNKSKKIKIGIRWQGNIKNERDLHRKIYLDDVMTMLLDVYKDNNVEFYTLQLDDGIEEASKYPQLIDITNKIQSYDDTLAILKNLDYVITSCTSVLHASAIVGTKTLALIPLQAYFTWLSPSPNNTSIWYGDNLILFKQTEPKKWTTPLKEMREYIKKNLL